MEKPTNSPDGLSLSVSIVLYRPDLVLLEKTLKTLEASVRLAKAKKSLQSSRLYIVDHDARRGEGSRYLEYIRGSLSGGCIADIVYIVGQGNIGFGRGHNLAISATNAAFHLVLNPDVEIEPDAIANGISILREHRDVGLLSPRSTGRQGEPQYLCKRYPSVLVLSLRGFAPGWMKSLFRTRLDRYEMRDVDRDSTQYDVPIVSGAFMLFRSGALKQIGGFRRDYFLYFEDFDISLRIAKIARVAYVPTVCIRHNGGYVAKKGWRHIVLFVRGGATFFRHHGWRWL